MNRCTWAQASEIDALYHDEEWGVESRDDRHLFEMLILEGAQAGLSWTTVLKKREAYRVAYDNFDPAIVAKYNSDDEKRLLADAGIIRNKLKIKSSIKNAQAFLLVQEEFGTFSDFLWAFVDGQPIINQWLSPDQVPAETEQSRALSKALKKRGFGFVGPTICYAYMQAAGLVNDHEINCFRHH